MKRRSTYMYRLNLLALIGTILLLLYLMLAIPPSDSLYSDEAWVREVSDRMKSPSDLQKFIGMMGKVSEGTRQIMRFLFDIAMIWMLVLLMLLTANTIYLKRRKEDATLEAVPGTATKD